MKKVDIIKYFDAEKEESLLFLLMGFAAVALAVYFYFFQKTNFYKGIAIPLLLVGVVQVVVGYTVYVRTDKQKQVLIKIFESDPAQFKKLELPRMETVNKNFIVYRWVEIALATVALVMVVLNRENLENFWIGFGMGLLLQSLLMLAADYFAEKRAKEYTNHVTAVSHRRF